MVFKDPGVSSTENSFEGGGGGGNGAHQATDDDDKARLAAGFGGKRRKAGSSSTGSSSSSKRSALGLFCYNPKTGEVLGRGGRGGWAAVAAYLLLFSGFLSAFWGLCLWVFYQTLDNYTPKLQHDSGSYVGQNPGLGYRPMRTETDPYSNLVWFRHGGAGNWDDFKNELDRFLLEYEPGYWANAGASQTKCSWERGPLSKAEACEFNKEWLSDQGSDIKCISEEHYGYYHGKPCILVKLNRIYGWTPEPYFNVTEVEVDVPGMPADLRAHIRQVWDENCRGRGPALEERCPQLNMVWLHCDGEDAADKENLGLVTYTPWRGFPAYFFPYYNQLGYLQPVVMVQLKNPTPGVLTNIECTAWARGIHHDRTKKRGSVHIELLMD